MRHTPTLLPLICRAAGADTAVFFRHAFFSRDAATIIYAMPRCDADSARDARRAQQRKRRARAFTMRAAIYAIYMMRARCRAALCAKRALPLMPAAAYHGYYYAAPFLMFTRDDMISAAALLAPLCCHIYAIDVYGFRHVAPPRLQRRLTRYFAAPLATPFFLRRCAAAITYTRHILALRACRRYAIRARYALIR